MQVFLEARALGTMAERAHRKFAGRPQKARANSSVRALPVGHDSAPLIVFTM